MSPTRPQHAVQSSARRAGFTLVELLVSLAIGLLLLLGVNTVFRMTNQTVSAGIALSGMARDVRSAQSVMARDFHYAMTNPPCFIIANHAINAGSLSYPNYVQGIKQRFRTDRLSFFASGDSYARQTADPGKYSSTTTSSDAYITYGIMAQVGPDSVSVNTPGPEGISYGLYRPPTWQDQSGNFYAQNWILGRNAVLLIDPNGIATNPIGDKNYYVRTTPGVGQMPNLCLGWNYAAAAAGASYTNANDPNDTYCPFFHMSRYDLVAVSADQFRRDLVAYEQKYQNDPYTAWWQQMFWYPQGIPITGPSNTNSNRPLPFICKSTVRKALSARDAALTTPIFINHVSNFVVEFAGDYVTQDQTDPFGRITAAAPDGKIDYVVDLSNPADFTSPHVQRIRWYGVRWDSRFPPDTNADTAFPSTAVNSTTPLTSMNTPANIRPDILPLHELLMPGKVPLPGVNTPDGQPLSAAGFVKYYPWDLPSNGISVNNWTNPNAQTDPGNYTCMWVNDAPALVRISFKVEDPTGGLKDGHWYEIILGQ